MHTPGDDRQSVTELDEVERLRLAMTIASYLLAPNQGERPNVALAHAALDLGLGAEYFSKAARVQVEPMFDDPMFRRAARVSA